MKIYGWNKLTLLDYPEHVAMTVFTGGCNFRCPFCHNMDLVLCAQQVETVEEDKILKHLEKRRGLLDGVCISGGEPTLQTDLLQFAEKIKKLGYLVKLDTNGYRPDVLQEMIQQGLVDYVAMDLKASRAEYEKVCGVPNLDFSKVEESIEILLQDRLAYEFRTTIVKGLHTPALMGEMAKLITNARRYYLQSFRENEKIDCHGMAAFSAEEMHEIQEMIKQYVPSVELRGIEE